MTGFNVKADDRDKGFRPVPISSISGSKGDLLELTAGSANWTKVTSSSDNFTRKAIAQADYATSDTEVLALEVDGSELVEVESANNSNASHNGDRMAATDENTVNNSGTDVTGQAAVFVQRGVVGAASDKRIVGNVLVGSGVDPDAV